jgi:molecular chaperone GrpE
MPQPRLPYFAQRQGEPRAMPKDPIHTDPLSGETLPGPEEEETIPPPQVSPEAPPPLLADVPDALLAEACKTRLCPACPVRGEAEDTKLRALADLDNTRKRMAREKEEHIRYAAESVLADIIPALDNLDLALAHAPGDAGSKNFVLGVKMTRKLLLDSLARHGLTEVGALGEPFDPSLHEALNTEANRDFAENTVCGLLGRGYRLKDRLLRPAKVTVCKF